MPISPKVDLDRFAPGNAAPDMRKKYGIPPGPMLLFVGRLDPEKKIEQILEAVKLAGAFAEFTFVVAGRGMQGPALRNLARQLGIDHRVVFTGFVAETDLPHLYRASRCFIIASDAELLSLATLQALACGLPVIAVNAGALQELVKDNENGYLFAPGDVATMSHCIIKLMTNDWLCRRMSEKSLQIAPEHDLRGAVDIFESLYEDECRNWILR